MSQRILVVNHEASRSGAPTVAVDVLDAFAALGATRILVHRWGGPFREEMDSHAEVSLIEPFAKARALARRWKPTRRLAIRIERAAAGRVLDTHRPTLVWCNTVLSANYVQAAQQCNIPVVLHAHESREDGARVLSRYGLVGVGRRGTAGVTLVGCAPRTAIQLAEVVGLPAESAVVLHSPVDLEAVERVRRPAGTPTSDQVRVVGCGQQLETKGAADFGAIARTLTADRPGAVSFTWIGGALGFFSTDSPVRHLGPVPTALPHLAEGDIFALTSRADQFPIVVLEAMAFGLAVVAFDVGDVTEQLGDTGVLIEPGDRRAMAAAIMRLIDDPAERRRLGVAARQRATELWGLDRFRAGVLAIAERATTQPKRQRVLHLVWRLSVSGGIQVVVRNLIDGLDPLAVGIDVATIRPSVAMDRLDELAESVTIHPLGLAERVSWYDYVRAALRFNALVRDLRPDIIHLHTGTAWIAAAATLLHPSVPVVFEVHDAPGHGRHSVRTEAFEGRLARRRRWWTVSHSSATQADVERQWGITPQRSVMFALGIDTSRFGDADGGRIAWRDRYGIAHDAVVLLCVARLVASKRVDMLLQAMALLPTGSAQLIVVGDGPAGDALKGLASELGIDSAVSFIGGLDYDEIPQAMGAADVAVSSSGYEGFGLTIIEAMAAGLGVVATAVGGVTDLVVDGVTGLLVADGDVEALAAALQRLIADADLRWAMGASGKARALSSFDIANFAANFAELYGRALRRPTA